MKQEKGKEEKSRRGDTQQRARRVETSAEGFAEDGLGAVHRLRFAYRLQRERPLSRQGMLVPVEAPTVRYGQNKVVTRCVCMRRP